MKISQAKSGTVVKLSEAGRQYADYVPSRYKFNFGHVVGIHNGSDDDLFIVVSTRTSRGEEILSLWELHHLDPAVDE
jgi:hypothetical protein